MIRQALVLFLLCGCSTWKQKDFKKDLEKPTEEAAPLVVSTPEEKKILEKFEVTDVDPSKKTPAPKPEKVVKKKVVVKKSKKDKTPVTKVIEVPKAAALPADYPPELIEINNKAKKVWDKYRSNHFVDQKVYMDIHYLGMTVGKIMVQNKGRKMIDGKEVWHFHARFKSAPFYSSIYELDDTVDTYVTTDNFLSTRYSLIQRETKQDIDDLQLQDHERLKTFWFYHRKKEDGSVKDKKAEKPIPYFSIDPFSVLFFYQGLPLKNKDVYNIPLVNKDKILLLHSVVEGREKISTEMGDRKAIRVHATTKYTGETLKSGDLYLWFSDDDHRKLLKAKAKIKIGSVTADIVEE